MPPSRKRFFLVTGSFVVHGALAFGLFVSGIWRIERLDPERRTIGLAVLEPPAPSGSPIGAQVVPKITPKQKKIVVTTIVQPVIKPTDTIPDATTAAALPGNGLGSGAGSGDNPDGNDDDTGSCRGPACGTKESPPVVKPPVIEKPPAPTVLPPTMLKALRVAGDTNIVPSDVVKTRMIRDDHTRSVAAFTVCIDEHGGIASVSLAASTHYPEYDAALGAAIRTWRYRPYLLNGRGVPACGVVTFVYTIK